MIFFVCVHDDSRHRQLQNLLADVSYNGNRQDADDRLDEAVKHGRWNPTRP